MALELKITHHAKDQTKKFRFNQEMSVNEVCAEIKAKFESGGWDYWNSDAAIFKNINNMCSARTMDYFHLVKME